MKLKARISVLILTFISLNVNAQNYDYTFCLGRVKLTLNAGGSARQILLASSGAIQSQVSGTYDKYDEGMPTEIIKVNFNGTYYRYELIKNGSSVPSMLIDAQGRKYSLCNYKPAKEKTLEDYDAEMKVRIAEDKRIQANLRAKAKLYFDAIKKLNLDLNNPGLKKHVPKNFDDIKAQYNDYTDLTNHFTKIELDFYNQFLQRKAKVIAENIKNTGDKYGISNNYSLNNYFNTNGQKVYLPESCRTKIYNEGSMYRNDENASGYVIDGHIYNSNDVLIGKLKQDEKYYFIDSVKIRLGRNDLIQLRTKKELVYVNMDNHLKTEIYNVTKDDTYRDSYQQIYTLDNKDSRGCILNAMITLYKWWK